MGRFPKAGVDVDAALARWHSGDPAWTDVERRLGSALAFARRELEHPPGRCRSAAAGDFGAAELAELERRYGAPIARRSAQEPRSPAPPSKDVRRALVRQRAARALRRCARAG